MSLDEDLRLTAKMHDSVGDTGIGDDLRQAADRLAWSEELLRQSWYYVEKGHPSLADKIDAFLSDGSE